MYNKDLEALIEAALADGVVTEKEKRVLFNKAQALGVDLDEFELVLNSRLAKIEKEYEKQAEAKAPKKGYKGELRKCPSCKANVGTLETKCPYCGHEFVEVNANSLTKELMEKVEKLRNEFDLRLNKTNDFDKKKDIEESKVSTIANTIQSFPLPITRDDLFEFIITMQTGMLIPSLFKGEGDAYRAKYTEAIMKASLLFPTDPILVQLIADKNNVLKQADKVRKKQKNIRKSSFFWMAFGMAIVLVVCVLIFFVPAIIFGNL